MLGLKLEWQRPDISLAHLRAGGALIDLIGGRRLYGEATDRQIGLDHFCLCLNGFSADQVARHLSAYGIHSDNPTLRNGAMGDGYSIYLRDPDGYGVELPGAGVVVNGVSKRF